MYQSISQDLHDFLREKRIMAEVARRMNKNLSTLACELNSNCPGAKFGIDELHPLCVAVREIGYDKELDGIMHNYLDTLRQNVSEPPSNDELLPLISALLEKTGLLASGAVRMLNGVNENELRQVASLLRSSLLPTTLRLGSLIDSRLQRFHRTGECSPEPLPES